jgi:hypothetical protein
MLSASAPTPPPPPIRIDTRVLEPDEQWKADLRKRIEHDLIHMVESAKIVRDTILNSQPTESSRERAERDYVESMNNIRTLAQEEFTRELRREVSERKWALDTVDSNSPDVARQQQWILDSIRKTDEKHIHPLPPDAPQNAEWAHPSSPQRQSDSEGGPDESSEDGYGTGGLEDEKDELGESTDGEREDGDEEDSKPGPSRPPSRPSVPLTQSLHSKSPVSRRNAPSLQRQPPNFQPAENNDGDDADDPPRLKLPPWQHASQHARQHQTQPHSPGGAPRRQSSGSRASVWRPVPPRAPEPSGIARTFAHANGQVYAGPIQFPRRGSVNSTGSAIGSAGLHRTGFMNSDQHRNGSDAPHGITERPSTQSRDIVSNIAPRERQTSASVSPHDRLNPPSYPAPPRAIPVARPSLDEAVRFPTSAGLGSRAIYDLQRSPEDMRQGIAIPRGPTTPEEGPRGTSWSSLNSRRFGDFNVDRRHNSIGEQRFPPVNGDLADESDDVVDGLDERQNVRSTRSIRSAMSIEQLAAWWETKARRKEEETTRREEEASRKEEEARCLEEKARQTLEEARQTLEEARQTLEEAKRLKAEASPKMRAASKRSLRAG